MNSFSLSRRDARRDVGRDVRRDGRFLRGIAPLALASMAAAQQVTLAPPAPISGVPSPLTFGDSVAILSDIDGGGRRDLLVGAPGDGGSSPTGVCYVLSSEGPQAPNPSTTIGPLVLNRLQFPSQPAITATGVQLGFAVLNIGNIDGVPGDEFAISAPRVQASFGFNGLVFIGSLRPQAGGTVQYVPLRYLRGPESFGHSLAMVNTPSGRMLAVGTPAVDEVRLFDPSVGLSPVTQPARTLNSGGRTGMHGFSLAAGPDVTPTGAPSYVLAVGAPTYNESLTNPQSEGYVAIYDLSLAGNGPTSFLYRGVGFERLGTAVASLGFLPNTGFPSSPLPDFAVLGRGNFSSILAMFHTPSTMSTQPTPTLASTSLQGSFVVNDGKMATLGDVDGDDLGEVAVAVAGQLQVFSPANSTLTALPIGNQGCAPGSGLASGPDVLSGGAVNLVVGPAFSSTNPSALTVRVPPLATTTNLPNLSPVSLSTNGARPLLSSPLGSFTYPLTVQYSGANSLVFLLAELGPPVGYTPPAPIAPGSTAYVNPGVAITLASGSVSFAAPFTHNMPTPWFGSGMYASIVFQAVVIPPVGSWQMSNGILGHFGLY